MGMREAVGGDRAVARWSGLRTARAPGARALFLIGIVFGVVLGVVGMHGVAATAHSAPGSAVAGSGHVPAAVPSAAHAVPTAGITASAHATPASGAATAIAAGTALHGDPACGSCSGRADGGGGAALCLLALLALGVALFLDRHRGLLPRVAAAVRAQLVVALARIPRPPSLIALGISRT